MSTPAGCPVNLTLVQTVPTPSAPELDTFSEVEFACIGSDDGKIALPADQRFVAGQDEFGFNKPGGAYVTVTGRPVDGNAPPLGVKLPPGGSYPRNLEVTALDFAAPGCREITIDANSGRLSFFAVAGAQVDSAATPRATASSFP